MVQVDIPQLAAECNAWRASLRGYRDEFTNDNRQLQDASRHLHSQDHLQRVEHLQNQFHIQLINIHDLKHSIKNHQRVMETELEKHQGKLREETLAMHDSLYAQYDQQQSMLHQLRKEFNQFLEGIKVG